MNAHNKKQEKTIAFRIERDKETLLEQLKKTPIVQIACEKSGISRATYYRWKNENAEFAKLADAAIKDGCLLMNDMAESQLLAAVKDRNMTAILTWLKYHHPSYATRVEINAHLDDARNELTSEQLALIKTALRHASLMLPTPNEKEEPKQ